MNAIVSIDKNWGIGFQDKLLFHATEDMEYFKNMTTGKIVVMGKKTFYSLPGQKPLKNRTNIVLSSDTKLTIKGVRICNNLDELLKLLNNFNPEDVFIIGGQTIYKMMLPYCSVAYVTQFYTDATADKHFPNLTKISEWKLVNCSVPIHSNGLTFTFDRYKKG